MVEAGRALSVRQPIFLSRDACSLSISMERESIHMPANNNWKIKKKMTVRLNRGRSSGIVFRTDTRPGSTRRSSGTSPGGETTIVTEITRSIRIAVVIK